MAQLLMKWDSSEPLQEMVIPEGFSFHQYHRGGDEVLTEDAFQYQWIDIRDPQHGERITWWYHIVYDDPRVPDDGFFLVLDKEGRIAASACIQLGEHMPDSATVHSVCAGEKFRGRGLGKAVTIAVMRYAKEHGIREVYLTTDDNRIPAVGLYLSLNFLPVLYLPDMRGRWQQLFEQLQMDHPGIIDEQGKVQQL